MAYTILYCSEQCNFYTGCGAMHWEQSCFYCLLCIFIGPVIFLLPQDHTQSSQWEARHLGVHRGGHTFSKEEQARGAGSGECHACVLMYCIKSRWTVIHRSLQHHCSVPSRCVCEELYLVSSNSMSTLCMTAWCTLESQSPWLCCWAPPLCLTPAGCCCWPNCYKVINHVWTSKPYIPP